MYFRIKLAVLVCALLGVFPAITMVVATDGSTGVASPRESRSIESTPVSDLSYTGDRSAPEAAVDDDEFTPEQIEFFESRIRPILVERCFECHGPDVEEPDGELSLASRAAAIAGGGTGPAIVPGDPLDSLLIEAINYDDIYEMPPDSKMPDEEIELLTEWVEMGAPWPGDSDEVVAAGEFDIEKLKSEHWCWQDVTSPQVPDLSEDLWALDDIDRFIQRRLNQEGLLPAADADRRSLIRRLSFDLTGLPPAVEEID
ncbi:MAG: c-type cytochrome domain-containing protein, partial [Planctomycetota bacterium]